MFTTMRPKTPYRSGPKYRERHLDQFGMIQRCGHRKREAELIPGHNAEACRDAIELWTVLWSLTSDGEGR